MTQPLEIGPEINAGGALKTGLCNFAMNRFGVTYPPLLALAERPVIPEINNLLHDWRPSAELMKWNGVTFKNRQSIEFK